MAGSGDGGTPIPVPIAQRLRAIVPAYKSLGLVLERVSPDDYRESLRSSDPEVLIEKVYPLERPWEIINNLVIELVQLALEELKIASVDGPRDLDAVAAEGIITTRLAGELADVHRARNDLTHEYPGVRASTVYEGCERLHKLVLPFFRSYVKWLGEIGYRVPEGLR